MIIQTMSKEEANKLGHATFNPCDHTVIDLNELKRGEMHTVSIKLPNGDYFTACLISSGEIAGVIDLKYHGEGIQKMLGFECETMTMEASLYCLSFNSNL